MVLLEAAKGKRYKCPYCDIRLDRLSLVNHIDKVHPEFVSEEFSAARQVFNLANKKTTGRCVICGKETKWNEEVWRYDKFNCNKCKAIAAQNAQKNMIQVHGMTSAQMLQQDDHQRKMLANRTISGTYKISRGGTWTFTGSYEKKLLEFSDQVMHYKYGDILSPGPTIEYEFEGKKHFWITDQYIVPYNLVIDCKDGGSNPNNREMESYRAKQDVKEAAIVKQGKYNYIRLTDNNFAQLLAIMMEIKEQLMEISDEVKPIIRINESIQLEFDESPISEYSAASGPVVGTGNPNTYIIQALRKNSFSQEPEYGVTDDLSLSSVFMCGEDKEMNRMDFTALKESYEVFTAFQFIPPADHKPNPNGRNIAEVISGKTFLTPDQILYDEDFQQVATLNDMLELSKDSLTATLKGETYKVPIIGESTVNPLDDLMYFEDENGIFVENMKTHLRSRSHTSLQEITNLTKKYIQAGKF